MLLKERVSNDLKEAMKAQDKETTAALRMILSELKYAQSAIDIKVELADSEAVKVIGNYQKKLEKSLEDYPEGDQRKSICNEIEIVARYLPKKIERATVEAVVQKTIDSTDERNFGKLMKLCMAELGAQGDGKIVSEILKLKLG
jgi:uncharacterized protein